MEKITPFLDKVSESGLNVVGVADPLSWDAQMPPARRTEVLFPGTQSILVLGNGGGALWDALVEDLRKEPPHLIRERNPLDAFVHRVVEGADSLLGSGQRRWFFAATEASIHLDFRVLAELAGLGTRSRLGLLLHPQFGSWFGLRAACFCHQLLPVTSFLGKDHCAECPGYCIPSCPGGAFPDGKWNVDSCFEYRSSKNGCTTCASRESCPVGGSHRYSSEELRYHYDPYKNRAILREKAEIRAEDDRADKTGSVWTDWRSRLAMQKSR